MNHDNGRMKTGVLLLNLGGPDSLDAVEPFLRNLFSDRDIIRLGPSFLQGPIASLIISSRLKKTLGAYRSIGGKSPLREITEAQAQALERRLNGKNEVKSDFSVFVGMRYWHPFIADTVTEMRKTGIRRFIVLSLYPQYSLATTGSSLKALRSILGIEENLGASLTIPGIRSARLFSSHEFEVVSIESWFDNPGYIESLAETIREGMAHYDSEPEVLFSAHGLPQKFIDDGDPYEKEIRGTVASVTEKIQMKWHLSYQSKTGPTKWLEPSTGRMIRTLGEKKVRNLLVVPVSFVSDHIETLYEIDRLYREEAAGFGMSIRRADSLNTRPLFIEALADMVLKASGFFDSNAHISCMS